MAQDIEEFLRMAAARKKQQAQQQAQPPAQPAAAPPQQVPQARPQKRQPQARQPAQRREPDIYIGDDAQSTQTHPNLSTRIKTTVSTQDIVEHATNLGDEVHSRHDVVDSRVSQKFDHDLGRLKKRDITAPEVVDHGRGKEDQPDLSFVRAMLMNPASAKQAFVLKEIFDRPDF